MFGILFRLDVFFVAMINLVTVCAHDNNQALALFEFIRMLFSAYMTRWCASLTDSAVFHARYVQ